MAWARGCGVQPMKEWSRTAMLRSDCVGSGHPVRVSAWRGWAWGGDEKGGVSDGPQHAGGGEAELWVGDVEQDARVLDAHGPRCRPVHRGVTLARLQLSLAPPFVVPLLRLAPVLLARQHLLRRLDQRPDRPRL